MAPQTRSTGGQSETGPLREPQRLLLVSDDPAETEMIRGFIADGSGAGAGLASFALDSAGDFRQAAVLSGDVDYAAVLLGRVGGTAGGVTLLRRAQVEHQLTGPFLLLAEKVDTGEREAATSAGAADILGKGELTAALFERAVNYAISLHWAHSRAAGLELFDAATGLTRQPLFWEVLSLAVRRARRNKDFLALLMLHLDCLEAPSGLPGIDPLDAVVPLVAQRLARVLRASDTIARLDNGHLAVLVESMPRAEDIQTVAEKVIAATAGLYETTGRTLSLAVNVGIALFPTSAGDVGGLLRTAAAATLASRDKGVNEFHFG